MGKSSTWHCSGCLPGDKGIGGHGWDSFSPPQPRQEFGCKYLHPQHQVLTYLTQCPLPAQGHGYARERMTLAGTLQRDGAWCTAPWSPLPCMILLLALQFGRSRQLPCMSEAAGPWAAGGNTGASSACTPQFGEEHPNFSSRDAGSRVWCCTGRQDWQHEASLLTLAPARQGRRLQSWRKHLHSASGCANEPQKTKAEMKGKASGMGPAWTACFGEAMEKGRGDVWQLRGQQANSEVINSL